MLYFRVKTATPHSVKTIVNQNWTNTGPYSALFIVQKTVGSLVLTFTLHISEMHVLQARIWRPLGWLILAKGHHRLLYNQRANTQHEQQCTKYFRT
jgi:hypothetical protein